jgi:hypothetical protein
MTPLEILNATSYRTSPRHGFLFFVICLTKARKNWACPQATYYSRGEYVARWSVSAAKKIWLRQRLEFVLRWQRSGITRL